MSPKSHTLDIYGTELYLATDRRSWATLRRRCNFLDKTAQSAGFAQFATWHPKDGSLTANIVVLWIDVKAHRSTLDLIDTAAHEASHAVSQILDYIGHEPKGTDEPSAYLVGWLTRWILDGLLPDSSG